jgi:hypothetical protein
MKKIQNIKFPDPLLDKQDKSDKDGYHWIETNYKDRRTQTCILLKEENGKGYYLPLDSPYELCREHNFPREGQGMYFIGHSEPEYNALKKFVPYNVFMPTLEFCNYISTKEWLDVFITIVTEFPEKINDIANFSFIVGSENKLYNGCYLKCHPFNNIIKDDNGLLSYNDKWAWKIKDSHSIRTGEDVISHVGNVFFYQKKYVENFGGNLLPIIVVNN